MTDLDRLLEIQREHQFYDEDYSGFMDKEEYDTLKSKINHAIQVEQRVREELKEVKIIRNACTSNFEDKELIRLDQLLEKILGDRE